MLMILQAFELFNETGEQVHLHDGIRLCDQTLAMIKAKRKRITASFKRELAVLKKIEERYELDSKTERS